MSEENRHGWTLSEGFGQENRPYPMWRVAPEFREAREKNPPEYPCADIADLLGVESDIPLAERASMLITPETSRVLYDEALRRDDCPPVMVSMKHAGELVPNVVLDRMEENRLAVLGGQGGLDTGTTTIFAPRQGVYAGVRARINRVAVDTNREARDFEGKYPGFKGVVWAKDLQERDIYAPGQKLTKDEIRQLVEDLYNPFHRALFAIAGSLFDRGHKEVLYIDGHSFPGDEAVSAYKVKAEDPKPLILVGTGGDPWKKGELKPGISRYGADDHVVRALVDVLMAKIPDDLVRDNPLIERKVAVNELWTGTKNIADFGKKPSKSPMMPESPEIASQAIQVEVNRVAFMKDGKYDREILEILHRAMHEAILAATEAMQRGR